MSAKSAAGKIGENTVYSLVLSYGISLYFVKKTNKKIELGKILRHMTKLKNKLQTLMYFIRIM